MHFSGRWEYVYLMIMYLTCTQWTLVPFLPERRKFAFDWFYTTITMQSHKPALLCHPIKITETNNSQLSCLHTFSSTSHHLNVLPWSEFWSVYCIVWYVFCSPAIVTTLGLVLQYSQQLKTTYNSVTADEKSLYISESIFQSCSHFNNLTYIVAKPKRYHCFLKWFQE